MEQHRSVTAQGVCGVISPTAPLTAPRETGGLLLSLISGSATRCYVGRSLTRGIERRFYGAGRGDAHVDRVACTLSAGSKMCNTL